MFFRLNGWVNSSLVKGLYKENKTIHHHYHKMQPFLGRVIKKRRCNQGGSPAWCNFLYDEHTLCIQVRHPCYTLSRTRFWKCHPLTLQKSFLSQVFFLKWHITFFTVPKLHWKSGNFLHTFATCQFGVNDIPSELTYFNAIPAFQLAHAAAFRTPCCSVISDARAIMLKYTLLCLEAVPNVGVASSVVSKSFNNFLHFKTCVQANHPRLDRFFNGVRL